jgi:hypothetical protein
VTFAGRSRQTHPSKSTRFFKFNSNPIADFGKDADGLTYLGPEHLLALKARAWLDLSTRKANGEAVDGGAVKKHKNDFFRIYQIVDPTSAGDVPERVRNDLREFAVRIRQESIDLKPLGLGGIELESVLEDIGRIYGLN